MALVQLEVNYVVVSLQIYTEDLCDKLDLCLRKLLLSADLLFLLLLGHICLPESLGAARRPG